MVSEWRPSPEDSIRAVGRKEGWSSLWHPAAVRGNGAIRQTATKLRLLGWFVGVECGGSKRNISVSFCSESSGRPTGRIRTYGLQHPVLREQASLGRLGPFGAGSEYCTSLP